LKNKKRLLHGNGFTGTIPSEIGLLTQLVLLYEIF